MMRKARTRTRWGFVFGLLASFLTCPPVWAQPDPKVPPEIPPRYRVGETLTLWANPGIYGAQGVSVQAEVIAVGSRTYILAEKSPALALAPATLSELFEKLENRPEPGGLLPNKGIVPALESIFGRLPQKFRSDSRLLILITLSPIASKPEISASFQISDQVSSYEAMRLYGQLSNEENILYVSAPAGIWTNWTPAAMKSFGLEVSHELQHLLAVAQRQAQYPTQEAWLSDVQAESAVVFNGFVRRPGELEPWLRKSWENPLVTSFGLNLGLASTFAAFLIDRFPTYGGFPLMNSLRARGRQAIEEIALRFSGVPSEFDALYGDFVSYVFTSASTQEALPNTWLHLGGNGLVLAPITLVDRITAYPYHFSGHLKPYSFLILSLDQELSNTARVHIGRPDSLLRPSACAADRSLFWKPLPGAIAIYATGCPETDINDYVSFELTIEN